MLFPKNTDSRKIQKWNKIENDIFDHILLTCGGPGYRDCIEEVFVEAKNR